MKKKLTTLLFGLLLAVGWTSSAFAQSATYKAADMTDWTYTWYDASGASHVENYVDSTGKAYEVTDKYQIYGMLKAIYMDKRFPGPFYSAYAPNKTTRQDPVYYGGIEGGWNIGLTHALGNITITPSNDDVGFQSIVVRDGNQVITSWTSSNGTTLPSGWSGTMTYYDPWLGDSYYHITSSSIVISNQLLAGHNSVQVVINARDFALLSTRSITVNGSSQNTGGSYTDHTWTINAQSTPAPDGTYTPNAEGYTAIMVAVNNSTQVVDANNSWQYTDSTQLINYIGNNIKFVKLLTDGLRINEGTLQAGTVFNCDGTYNKFFILGKGQARKKSDAVLTRISNGSLNSYAGEQGPFKQMFEEFSPTTGGSGDQITDFYSRMMEGQTYKVVHDCASVIENGHQFSMSGNTGTNEYALSGLNFYIPDYRLLWWANGNYDGRDMNEYVQTNSNTGVHNNYTGSLNSVSEWAAWFAQYNQDYAPQIGIYKITLDAEAEPRTDIPLTQEAGNRNYKVTLEWHSSLNDMTGDIVPQTYTVYYYDNDGKRQALVVTGYTNTDGETGLTTLTYYVEQFAHSYTIDYIVMGMPNTNTHPNFVAWSNIDGVTIPGWDDFVILSLDHHESDFLVSNNEKNNWYRNFLLVENDIDPTKGLTVTSINDGMNKLDLLRYDNKDGSEKKIATVTFDNASSNQVRYTMTYDDNGSNDGLWDQNILKLSGKEDKYLRSTMQIPDQGYFRVMGNGDIIIRPNGYAVNFKAIRIKNNGSNINGQTWNSNQSNLPNGWGVSPGSVWVKYTNGDYYLEGGGYIYIPGILTNSNYNNVTVEIDAYGDGTALARIDVNDHRQAIDNGDATTHIWSDAQLRTNLPSRNGNRLTSDVTFTAGNNTSNTTNPSTITVDGVTITNNHPNTASNASFNSNPYRLYAGTLNISTTSGTITKIVFNGGNNTSYPVSRISGEGYTYSGNVGTWTGNASSVDLNLSGQVRCSSIVVTRETPDGADRTGVVRLALLTVDQFKEQVKDDNTHPDTYYYYLKYTPTDQTQEAKETGKVPVDILKTQVEVHGNYTKEQIDNDTDAALTMNIISADVTMDLTDMDPLVLYYEMQGKANGDPGANADWLTKLQQMTNGKFKEMLQTLPNGSENPAYGTDYDATIHHYYDENIVQGTYAGENYFTYAPSVSTWGIDRRYYEIDGEDNNYGGPLWKTGVGDVEITEATAQKQMKQVATENGGTTWIPNPSTSWTEGDVEGAQAYTLYFLSTQAQGYLPKTTVSNIAYEPYMFRVFVESASGKLRAFEPVIYTDPNTGAQTQIGLTDGGPITGKYCVGSYDINSGTWDTANLKFTKTISNDAPAGDNPGWNGNMKFGYAADGTDLKVYVRFYYMTPGWNTRAGDGPDRPGNGAEKGGDPTPSTGIFEIFGAGFGEVVSTTYYNAQGIQSDKPFDGLNIIVTRYSNGTTSTTKVIR